MLPRKIDLTDILYSPCQEEQNWRENLYMKKEL